jgi:hypothetical protein
VHSGLGVSIVPLRAGDDPMSLQVRMVPFSGVSARRVVGIVQAPSHPKAALVGMLLHALKALSRVTSQTSAHALSK